MSPKKVPSDAADEDERLTRELEDTFPASDPPSLTEPGDGVAGDPSADDRLQKIRQRAYEIWLAEGGAHGRHDDHWRRAESELHKGAEPNAKRPR